MQHSASAPPAGGHRPARSGCVPTRASFSIGSGVVDVHTLNYRNICSDGQWVGSTCRATPVRSGRRQPSDGILCSRITETFDRERSPVGTVRRLVSGHLDASQTFLSILGSIAVIVLMLILRSAARRRTARAGCSHAVPLAQGHLLLGAGQCCVCVLWYRTPAVAALLGLFTAGWLSPCRTADQYHRLAVHPLQPAVLGGRPHRSTGARRCDRHPCLSVHHAGGRQLIEAGQSTGRIVHIPNRSVLYAHGPEFHRAV